MAVAMSEANQIITTGSITHPSIGIIGFSVTARDRKHGEPSSRCLYRTTIPEGPAAAAERRDGEDHLEPERLQPDRQRAGWSTPRR